MPVTPDQLLASNDLLRALDLIGVVVMGITGGALASRLRFDAVGFAVIGIVSGLGGGILRDLILDLGVPAAFAGPWYLVCALAGAAFSYIVAADGRHWRNAMTLLDALALGLWAAAGTAKSLDAGLDPLPAILLGVLSAVGGGAIRDLLVGRIPGIFGGGPLYATSALATAIPTWAVLALGLPGWSIVGTVLLGSALAAVSAWRRWGLPQHQEWQVTFSATQMKALVRRVRRSERRRVQRETGAIPVVGGLQGMRDDFADDAGAVDDTADDYALAATGSGADIIERFDPEPHVESAEDQARDPRDHASRDQGCNEQGHSERGRRDQDRAT